MFKRIKQDFQYSNTDFPLINAVLLNKQEGKIFSDDSAMFVLHKAGFAYLKTSENSYNYKRFIDFILNSEDIPVYFHIYNPSQQLIDECDTHNSINIKVRKRIHLKFTQQNLPGESYPVPAKYSVQKISEYNLKSLALFNLNISSKFWSSENDFLNNGFGFIVCNENNEPVSICYTACIAQNEAEVDVATLELYQKKGMANIATQKFVQHCIENNIIANWDCFEDNKGSLKVAQQIGFNSELNYNFLSIFIN